MTNRAAITPRLLDAPAAALYLGVSESMLRTLEIPRKALRTKRLYERADLDAFANSLSYADGYQPPPSNLGNTANVSRPKQWAHR